MKDEIRHEEYVKQLLEARKKEVIKLDPINQRNLAKGEGLTSPTSNGTTEETRILKEYMEQRNLIKVSEADPTRKKALTLKKFFKMKRNQQVEIYSKNGNKSIYTEGKVNAIGRDFVMITNLKNRFWIPYRVIDSANIPFGIPTYSNTHQHYLYDNNLRKKILQNFGATVSQKETLIQQFHEESLQTNLSRWKNSWVEIKYSENHVQYGKILETSKNTVILKRFKKIYHIPLKGIEIIETIRFLDVFIRLVKKA